MIIVDMPWIMNGENEPIFSTFVPFLKLQKKKKLVTSCATAAWKIVKSWLGPEAISKLKFASKSEVQNFVNLEHLPPHLGGTVGCCVYPG